MRATVARQPLSDPNRWITTLVGPQPSWRPDYGRRYGPTHLERSGQAATDAGSEGAKTTTGLLARALGPSADVLGQALAQYTEFRVRNVGKILGRSEKKARESRRSGSVHPRVAHRVLEEGSFCDDAVMADYLGGVLAGSRAPNGRDDRAVAWSDLVTGMSAAQIRLHYLLYREWAIRLHGELALGQLSLGHDDTAFMYTDLTEVTKALHVYDDDPEPSGVLTHAIVGLHRQGLVNSYRQGEVPEEVWGWREPYPRFLYVSPSFSGLELYGWAQGLSGLTPEAFVLEALAFDVDPPLPRLRSVTIPNINR
jgi:hypothetical protein